MADFHGALEYTLENEGGFSNHGEDHGGATKYGISSVLLSSFLQRAATISDVQNLDRDDAEEIYKKYFWGPLRLSEIEDQMIATAIFDCAVSMGPNQAVKITQVVTNDLFKHFFTLFGPSDLQVDGRMGPQTLEWVNKVDRGLFIKLFRIQLLTKYSDIVAKMPNQKVFITGWTRRADRLLTLVDA